MNEITKVKDTIHMDELWLELLSFCLLCGHKRHEFYIDEYFCHYVRTYECDNIKMEIHMDFEFEGIMYNLDIYTKRIYDTDTCDVDTELTDNLWINQHGQEVKLHRSKVVTQQALELIKESN